MTLELEVNAAVRYPVSPEDTIRVERIGEDTIQVVYHSGGQWGAATDGTLFYVGANDFLTDTPGGLHALRDGLPHGDFHAAALIFTAVTFALLETAGGWLEWTAMRRLTLAHLPAIVLGMLTIGTRHPLAGQGVVAWPLNFVVFFWCLH